RPLRTASSSVLPSKIEPCGPISNLFGARAESELRSCSAGGIAANRAWAAGGAGPEQLNRGRRRTRTPYVRAASSRVALASLLAVPPPSLRSETTSLVARLAAPVRTLRRNGGRHGGDLVLPQHHPLLQRREQVHDGPVEHETRRKVVEEHQHH